MSPRKRAAKVRQLDRENMISDKREKQMWYCDHTFIIIGRMRKAVDKWVLRQEDALRDAASHSIMELRKLLLEAEMELSTTRRKADCEHAYLRIEHRHWETGKSLDVWKKPSLLPPCRHANKPGGCEYKNYDACPYNHGHEGKICKTINSGENCMYSECIYLHPKGVSLSTVTQGIARGISPALTPRTPSVPCPLVNAPGGCPGRQNQTCQYGHFNANAECKDYKSKDGCKRGGKCRFLHHMPDRRAPQQSSAPSHLKKDKDQDLRSVHGQVLANPENFNACRFVNKPLTGCFNCQDCTFNHSLAGVKCQNTTRYGWCVSQNCPLLHDTTPHTDQQQQTGLSNRIHAGMRNLVTNDSPKDNRKNHASYEQEQELNTINSTKRKYQAGLYPTHTKHLHLAQPPACVPARSRRRDQYQARQIYSPQYPPTHLAGNGQSSSSQFSQPELLNPSHQPYHAPYYPPSHGQQPPANAPEGSQAMDPLRPAVQPRAQRFRTLRHPAAGQQLYQQQLAFQHDLASLQGPNGLQIRGESTRDGSRKRIYDDCDDDIDMNNIGGTPEPVSKRNKRRGKNNDNVNPERGAGRGDRGGRGGGQGSVQT
jgi:hypothetical protein